MKIIINRIKAYFITGLLVVTPIWGTYLILKTLLGAMEGVLGKLIRQYAGGFYVPGLGISALLLLILATGMLTRNIFGRKVVQIGDAVVHRVPIVSTVYGTIKRIVDTLSLRSSERFSKVVLVEFPRKGIYSLGFVTGVAVGEVQAKTNAKVLTVYVPTTPNPTSGYLLMVPEGEVTTLSMGVEDGLKMIISGGMVSPPEKGEDKPSNPAAPPDKGAPTSRTT